MTPLPNVIVAMARCSARPDQQYGIRIEEMGTANWAATWAFVLPAATAAREGYDRSEVRGSFGVADGYPGCPTCAQGGFVKCGSCGALGCWESAPEHVCPWCGRTAAVSGRIGDLRAGGDR